MKTMAPILATTLGIFDIVVPGSNREALASHNQSLSIKSSHSEALASGVLDLKYEQKTLGLSFWCLFLRLSEQMLYIYIGYIRKRQTEYARRFILFTVVALTV